MRNLPYTKTDKITEQERLHVDIAGNLSDAQVYLPLSQAQLSAIPGADFFSIPRSAIDIDDLKPRFFEKLAAFHGGLRLPPSDDWFICYSASNAIEIAANALRQMGMRTVGLLHPTFDATYHIFRRHGMRLLPIEESTLIDLSSGSGFAGSGLGRIDALVVTLPNNPSGRDLSIEHFTELARAASEENVVLIIDACFRAYRAGSVSHHEILASAATDAIVIEDSGKLFNLKDIKLGAAWCTGRPRALFHEIHCDFILDAPVFSLECITRFLEVSGPEYCGHLRAIVQRNRAASIRALSSFGLVAEGSGHSNIQLFRLTNGLAANAIANQMTARRVGIVAANAFFWHHCNGEFVRLALARDPEEFDRHIEVMSNCLREAIAQKAASPVY